MRLALLEPDQPGNVGAVLRLAACFALPLDLVEPMGFPFGDRSLARSAMDYGALAQVRRHADWAAFAAAAPGRLVLLTTAGTAVHDFAFAAGDTLMFGSESRGASAAVHARADALLRIPMAAGARSLNIAVAAGIAAAEAIRQDGGFGDRLR